ncbi:MAG: PKD domain-containing protein [Crocinitomicaceae bacterium]|nr:PKD domain-containing protein [Crocinitomicaceae bacterium]
MPESYESLLSLPYQYTLGNCPDVMFFDGSTSSGPNAMIISWDYDFGDGNTSTSQNSANTYTQNGSYYVCLTIFDSDGCTSTYCDSIIISCLASPSCDAAFQYTMALCSEVMFFDGSTTSTGTIVDWAYDFGDGSTGTGADLSHTYTTDGTYQVCLTITSSDSCIESKSWY